MKKLLPFLLIGVVVVGLGYYLLGRDGGTDAVEKPWPKQAIPASATTAPEDRSGENNGSAPAPEATTGEGDVSASAGGDEANTPDQDKSATELYHNADEALAAIKKAALDYDDLILEQFTTPGEDCTWCDSLYASVKSILASSDTPNDQKSYYAELLAVSGRMENIQTLVDSIKSAPNQEQADVYAEALELTVGKEEVTKYLGDLINSDNETLKEASVAAVTNQGTRSAVELLYKNAVDKNDPDGFYAMGIGLGELVPEEEAMPYLQEIMLKRDAYSHLAVKALLNGGADGLKIVLEALGNSQNPEADKQMLKDALDHVNFDDDTRDILNKYSDASNTSSAGEFARKALEELKKEEEDNSGKGGSSDSPDAMAMPPTSENP